MAETACVMHAFTFPSYEASQQGDRYEGLHESVSFGRFATESLAWDRWSTFPNKRYVEEAAKHSQPGLVARKKAFFEDYYKKKALLQQENEAEEENHAPGLSTEVGDLNFPAAQAAVERLEVDAGLPDEDSETPGVQVEEIAETKLCDYVEKSEAMLKEVEAGQEGSEVVTIARKMLPACPQPPSFPKALSSRSCSVKRSELGLLDRSAPDIRNSGTDTLEESHAQVVSSSASGTDSSKRLPGRVVSAQTETKRTETLPESPACRSRRSGNDNRRLLSEYPNARNESKLAAISSPFSSRTGKGTEEKIEKLDEILSKKAVRKVQFQMKIRDKAASQLKKLRRSFCFSSSQAPKSHAKIFLACFQPAKVAEAESSIGKHVEKQRSQRKLRPGSLAEMIAQKRKSSSDLMS
uniref:Protein WVD2-like 7 n=1 Tax=Kalanchoe fedtschenkoi TaxID=63787 RepID=A0A7N0TRA3_KALFE